MREPDRIDELSVRRETIIAPSTDAHDAPRAETPDAVRADIERTREEMGGTVDAIQDRLAPDRLAEQAKAAISDVADHAVRTAKEAIHDVSEHAKDTVRDATIGRAENMVSEAGATAKGFGATMTETIRQNPVPAMLVGIGLGWLFIRSRNIDGRAAYRRAERSRAADYGYNYRPDYGAEYGYGIAVPVPGETRGTGTRLADTSRATAGQMVSGVKETVSDVVSSTQETVSDVTAKAQETVSDVAAKAREQADYLSYEAQRRTYQVQGQFEQLLQDNPLALGAVALACGAAIGMLLPTTERENELMGSARDTLVESARETAQDTMQKVQQVAEKAQHAAEDEAKDQGLAA